MAGEIGSGSISTPGKGKAKKAKTTDGPLFKVNWKRIVADEGHVLKNPKAKSRHHRWLVADDSDTSVCRSFCGKEVDRYGNSHRQFA